jgi:hypothetical protein
MHDNEPFEPHVINEPLEEPELSESDLEEIKQNRAEREELKVLMGKFQSCCYTNRDLWRLKWLRSKHSLQPII